jgi:spore germination cell wall hydrolase CwlJ-like protein
MRELAAELQQDGGRCGCATFRRYTDTMAHVSESNGTWPRRLPGLAAVTLVVAFLAGGCADSEPMTEPPDPSAAADAEQQRCLALSMYWEAKAEGRQGMLAVGHVVMNRVRHELFPEEPCAVVFEGGETPPCQFSWWCDGKSDRPRELQNWQLAQALALELLTRELPDPTRGALFFHATGMSNPWRIQRTKTVTIGGHVFYGM